MNEPWWMQIDCECPDVEQRAKDRLMFRVYLGGLAFGVAVWSWVIWLV
jgi:hypothetical protein